MIEDSYGNINQTSWGCALALLSLEINPFGGDSLKLVACFRLCLDAPNDGVLLSEMHRCDAVLLQRHVLH